MITINNSALKLLSFDKTGFFLWLYIKYVPERADILMALFSFSRSIHKIYEDFAKRQRRNEIVISNCEKTDRLNLMRLYVAGIIKKTIGASSSYFGEKIKTAEDQKESLFSRISPKRDFFILNK